MKREFYLSYLNSSEWKTRRNHKLRSVNYRCEKCSSKRDLEVHHLSYEHVGHESDNELQVLCSTCHRNDHLHEVEDSSHRIYLKLASELLQKQPFSEVAELSAALKDRCLELHIEYVPRVADRAIGLLAHTNRLERPVGLKSGAAPRTFKRADFGLSSRDAKEIITRIFAGLDISPTVKTMPTCGDFQRVDAPVVVDDYVEHDLY